MVSGSCVMTDTMLSIPRDYKDGENIVFYDSAESLQAKVIYYLENETERLKIARRGLEVTLNHHRSWHHMEEIIFGRVID